MLDIDMAKLKVKLLEIALITDRDDRCEALDAFWDQHIVEVSRTWHVSKEMVHHLKADNRFKEIKNIEIRNVHSVLGEDIHSDKMSIVEEVPETKPSKYDPDRVETEDWALFESRTKVKIFLVRP